MHFSPSIYEHAAKLIGKSPWEVSRDEDLIFTAHKRAYEIYHHSPIVVGIDIYNLEAEAYGAYVVNPGEQGIPAITENICSGVGDIQQLNHFNPTIDGRIPAIIEAGAKLTDEFPDADVRIPVSGPFSIAANLIGLNTLLSEILTDPETTKSALLHLVEGQIKFYKEIARNKLGVTIFESAAAPPLLSPDLFREIELPVLQILFHECERIAGHPLPCILGGDTAPIIEDILQTGTRYVICPSETDQTVFMEKLIAYPDVMVRVNMNPEIIVSGNMSEIYTEVDRVMKLAQQREKVCIGTGVLPYETDPDVVLKIKEYILSE